MYVSTVSWKVTLAEMKCFRTGCQNKPTEAVTYTCAIEETMTIDFYEPC
jgi:hypothetical protein